MQLRLSKFSGEQPKINPRLQAPGAAQEAFNVRLDDGALTPVRQLRFETSLAGGGPYGSIFRVGDQEGWLAFTEKDVHVVRGPVARDRLYITGMADDIPRVRVGATVYPLPLNPPATKPQAYIDSGEVDNKLSATVVYAYTFLTVLDEESEPSPLTDGLLWSPGLKVKVVGFELPPQDRGVTRMRLYRSQTDSTGATGLFFVAERDLNTTPWIHDLATDPIQEAIPSVSYNAAPVGLSGIIALPNGMMAGFIKGTNKLCFCEPYKPHAWPIKYQLTTDYPIVGLGAFGSSVAVLTEGNPYVVAGSAPENMQMEKLETNQPCINARTIVDLGYVVLYASHEGLVSISSQGCVLASGAVISREQWQEMNPYSMSAAQYSGRYMASYAYTDRNGVEQRGQFIFDLGGAFVSRGGDYPEAMFYEIETGALYLLRNGTEIFEWDPAGEEYGELRWRSTQFMYATPLNFGCILIETDKRLGTADAAARADAIRASNQRLIDAMAAKGEIAGAALAVVPFAGSLLEDVRFTKPYVEVTVYADGKPLIVISSTDRVERLPGRSMYSWVEIAVKANVPITAISLASQPSELATT